jgi:hypothetical protein
VPLGIEVFPAVTRSLTLAFAPVLIEAIEIPSVFA